MTQTLPGCLYFFQLQNIKLQKMKTCLVKSIKPDLQPWPQLMRPGSIPDEAARQSLKHGALDCAWSCNNALIKKPTMGTSLLAGKPVARGSCQPIPLHNGPPRSSLRHDKGKPKLLARQTRRQASGFAE